MLVFQRKLGLVPSGKYFLYPTMQMFYRGVFHSSRLQGWRRYIYSQRLHHTSAPERLKVQWEAVTISAIIFSSERHGGTPFCEH